MGQGGRQKGHTKAVQSEKYVRCRRTMSARNAPDRDIVWPACLCYADLTTICVLQSVTSGKAGGLQIREPLKADRGCEPLKAVRL
jgi:hypothetical protein